MFSAVRASSIRHTQLPAVQCPGIFISTSCTAAAQFRNYYTRSEHVQPTPEHGLPRHADEVGDGRLTRRIRSFPIASIRRIYIHNPGATNSKNGKTNSRTPQYPQPRTQEQLSQALERSNDTYDLLDLINTQVLSHQDGVQLLSASAALIKALQKPQAHVRELRAFNIIIARLRHVGIELNKALLVFGVQCAARAGSFEALARYLNIAASHGHHLGVKQFGPLLENLLDYLFRDGRVLNQSWGGLRRKQQLLRILTGWQCDGVRRGDEERQPCLFMAMPQSEVSWWQTYTSLLRIVGGKDVVFGEWLNFKHSLPDNPCPDKGDSETTRSSVMTENAEIAGCFVRSLILANDAERAWQVIQDSGSEVGAVSDTTWSMLLDYPQHIREWQPAMAEKVIKKYEEYMIKIEAAMAITWVGGEDGYHVASVQGETTDESEGPEELGEGLDSIGMRAKAGTSHSKCTSETRPQRQT